jgi:hypothetical protein
MPPIYASHLPWSIDGPPDEQQVVFHLASSYAPWTRLAEITVCNSFLDAEPTAFELFPDIVPIGPLFADEEVRKPVGQFWPEDASCLEWLDAQSDSSVVYVAFGSFTIFGPRQFQELAEGLELTGRPFLWVVRPDFTSGGLSKAWFDEFSSRMAGKGMIVSWCPQQKVLICNHSIALGYGVSEILIHFILEKKKLIHFDKCRFWRIPRWPASCRTAGGTRRRKGSGTACRSCAGPTSPINSRTGATFATSG